MIEMHLIYIIYIVLYFFESLFWIPKNSVILYFSKKKNAKLYYTSELFCNQKSSLAVSSLFFPSRLFSVMPIPKISISEEHIFAYAISSLKERQSQTSYTSYKFSEIEKIETDDNELFINGKLFVKFYSSAQAKFWADNISMFLNTDKKERIGHTYDVADILLDENGLAMKIKIYFEETKILRVINSVLLYTLIINALSVFFISWFADYFWYTVIALYTLSILSGIYFYVAQKKLTTIKKSKRIFNALKKMFYPPSTIGSVTELSTNMFSEFHPFTVASVLCDKPTFEKFAGKILRDLLNPLAHTYPEDDATKKEIETAWRNRISADVINFLAERGYDLDALIEPEHTDNEIAYYCPRCLTLYSKYLENCSDCYGVALQEVDKKPTT